MSVPRLAERCRALLGAHTSVLVGGRDGARWRSALEAQGIPTVALDAPAAPATAGVLSFLGDAAPSAERQRCLATMRERLMAGGRLVLVDHNQPRTWGRRVVGILALAALGFGPARARRLAARELAAAGFGIESLHLVAGERVQLIVGVRSD